MAVRETRASWRRLLFFFICIAVGVAAIVALRSVIQSVRAVFGTEAKSLIAADVLISTNRDWTPEARATIDRRLSEYGATTQTETVETPTMVRPADLSRNVARMSELRAVGPEFPLYGTLTLQGGATYSHSLLKGQGVLVRPELLTALNLAVGDQVLIGQVPFTIRGVIVDEPGRRVGDFSLGPRVLIDTADLQATGLLIEQRRLFYVSVTRAMACCIVSHAAQHSGAQAMALTQSPIARLTRSQFLNEMDVKSVTRNNGLSKTEAAAIIAEIANL